MPYQLTNCVIGFFFQVFLLYTVKLSPLAVAAVFLSGRLWDVVSDPVIGWAVAQTPPTRCGRLTLWTMLAAPLAGATYVALWLVPSFEPKLPYYIALYCLFQMFQSCFHIPYTSLTMRLSASKDDRDSATTYRMVAEVIGLVIGVLAQSFFVGDKAGCEETRDSDQSAGYRRAALLAGGLYVVCTAVLVAGVGLDDAPAGRAPGLSDYRAAIRHGPAATLLGAAFLTAAAFFFIQGNFALFCVQVLRLPGADCQRFVLVLIVSSGLFVPFWRWTLRRLGKKHTLYLGNMLCAPFIVAMVLSGPSPGVLYAVSAGAGASVAAVFYLPWTMLPDVIEGFAARTAAARCDSLFFSAHILMTKLAAGLAMVLSALTLEAAGYVGGACAQRPSVHLALRLLVSVVPVLLTAVGLGILSRYPDDTPKVKWTAGSSEVESADAEH